jgi:hypothetical protein
MPTATSPNLTALSIRQDDECSPRFEDEEGQNYIWGLGGLDVGAYLDHYLRDNGQEDWVWRLADSEASSQTSIRCTNIASNDCGIKDECSKCSKGISVTL